MSRNQKFHFVQKIIIKKSPVGHTKTLGEEETTFQERRGKASRRFGRAAANDPSFPFFFFSTKKVPLPLLTSFFPPSLSRHVTPSEGGKPPPPPSGYSKKKGKWRPCDDWRSNRRFSIRPPPIQPYFLPPSSVSQFFFFLHPVEGFFIRNRENYEYSTFLIHVVGNINFRIGLHTCPPPLQNSTPFLVGLLRNELFIDRRQSSTRNLKLSSASGAHPSLSVVVIYT